MITKNKRIDPVEFAKALIHDHAASNYSTTSGNRLFDKKIAALRKECEKINGKYFSARIYILLWAGDQIADVSTSEALWYKIQCYVYAGALGRQGVITWAPIYIASGDYYLPGVSMYTPEKKREVHVEMLKKDLARSYEGEKMLAEALTVFSGLHHEQPGNEWYIIDMVRVLVKLGRTEGAIEVLMAKTKTAFYKRNGSIDALGRVRAENFYRAAIDKALADVSKKKSNCK